MDVIVKGHFLEKMCAEVCDKWKNKFPIDFEAFRVAMESARQDMKTGATGRTEMEIPDFIHKEIALLVGENGRPNSRWTYDKPLRAAFMNVFLIGMLAPVENRAGVREQGGVS